MTGGFPHLVYELLALVALGALVWHSIRVFKNSENRTGLAVRWIVTAVLAAAGCGLAAKWWAGESSAWAIPFIVMVVGVVFSVLWTPALSDWITRPFTNIFDGGSDSLELKPLYSIALAKRQKGQYLEATVVVREQLVRFPNDLEGILLLARIQAEDMKDISSAEMTLNRFCAHPRIPPAHFAAAMTHLADWHLHVTQDADAARLDLQKIIDQYPETELALGAAQRLAHLVDAEKMLAARHHPQAIARPPGVERVGLLASSEFLQAAEENPARLAGAYVKHLGEHPQDTEAREKLAVIYADHYQRLDMAAAELRQMIDQPNQPPKRVAHWLTLLANLQIRHGADYETVRRTLEEIVNTFPNLPVAQSARSRINHLNLEMKGRQGETEVKRLGAYEQNIGLRKKPPD